MELLLLLLGLVSVVSALDTISVTGKKFFTSNGTQFFIKGVAYQLSPDDAFNTTVQCQADAKKLQELGANVIRSYRVNPFHDHSGCIQAFEDAGIYIIIDLQNPSYDAYINEDNPLWNDNIFNYSRTVIDKYANYNNILGFFSANEIITRPNGTNAAPYVKASVRDCKAYIKSQGYRDIPIGYAAADISSIRPMLQNFLACGDESDSIDFWGLNIYEWCYAADTNYETSGYRDRTNEIMDLPIPAFFSEFGCNTIEPRTFDDIPILLGPEMDNEWSGGIVYEWLEESNNYGIVSYTTQATNSTAATPIPIQPDFNNLQGVWANSTPTGVSSADYTPTVTSIACPAMVSGTWNVNASEPLPPSPIAGTTTQNWQYMALGSATPYTASATPTATATATPTPTGTSTTTDTKTAKSSSNTKFAALTFWSAPTVAFFGMALFFFNGIFLVL